MYPAGDLNRLARRKAWLRERIARERGEISGHARVLARPVALADRAVDLWRRTSPWIKYAAIPLGFFSRRRSVARHLGRLPRMLRWAPVALRALRIFRDVTAAKSRAR